MSIIIIIIIIILAIGRQDVGHFIVSQRVFDVFVAEMAISRSIENKFAKYYIFRSGRIQVRYLVKKLNIFIMFGRVQLFIHMRQSPSIDSLCYYYFHFEWYLLYIPYTCGVVLQVVRRSFLYSRRANARVAQRSGASLRPSTARCFCRPRLFVHSDRMILLPWAPVSCEVYENISVSLYSLSFSLMGIQFHQGLRYGGGEVDRRR